MLKGLLTRREQAILISVAAALLVGSGLFGWQRHRAKGITIIHGEGTGVSLPGEDRPSRESAVPSPASSQTTEPAAAEGESQTDEISINVAGAVKSPGVYRLRAGSVVEDAVIAAGGYADDADPAGINRAAKLIDATTLNVPAKPSIYAAPDSEPVLKVPPRVTNIPAYLPGSVPLVANERTLPGRDGTLPSGKVNINTASSEELQTLPRIGPKLAAAIIEYRSKRPFRSIEEIQNVPRIGPKTFAGLKDLITVSGE